MDVMHTACIPTLHVCWEVWVLYMTAGWSCPRQACAEGYSSCLVRICIYRRHFTMHMLLANPHHAYAPKVAVVGLVCVCAVLFCLRNYVDILVALVSRSLRCSFCCKVRVFSQPFSYISAYLHYLIACACRFTCVHSTVSCLHVDLRAFTCISVFRFPLPKTRFV